MRHRRKKGRLSRNRSHRFAMLRNMTASLLKHQRIETTFEKACVLRSYAEKVITLAKKGPDSIFAKREAARKLNDKEAVRILFGAIAPLFKDVPGGYTRVMPMGVRKGDGARMAVIELTRRTISDEDLLGKPAVPKKREKKKPETRVRPPARRAGKPEEREKPRAAAPVSVAEEEERLVEDVKKEKAKQEEKKIIRGGFFRYFRRKSG